MKSFSAFGTFQNGISIYNFAACLCSDCFKCNHRGFNAGPIYTCRATFNTLDNNEAIMAVTCTGATATAPLQTSDSKVLYVTNSYMLRIERLPSNMPSIFPNLMAIYFTNGKLRKISSSDFESYPDLTVVSLGYNMIKKLDGNLFHNNPKLQYIDFSANSIEEIDPAVLNGLNFLKTFNIYGSICSGMSYSLIFSPPINTLADFQRDLNFVCGPSTPSEESGTCDPCLVNCTARAAVLQIRANAVTESVYAPWYYKMRAFLKAVSLW